ncbi:hypothetical protein AGDE_04697 [Angomonas deanei]|uniref:Mitochondrial RNA binding complex 1 subunit domain-containing protein n=1 Tax=Angomonas deanei TaxID=59799 RepID=A0A7G2C9S9_9TRYP|nr:hypothetical protein AGDE_04697 [Angomonas deanei]CAD2215801.1 hypothetical protein, conserved [Angomonas deanei]|eukprot:EPY39231.1 hypothetical protein AGDE_04697 [Angomonas deanei]
MHELRRTLYYVTSMREKEWLDVPHYTQLMRALTVEFLRRENNGVLAPEDVLYISTHVIVANFYNRHLWNRLEHSLAHGMYDHIDLATIKALTTRLFKSRPGCAKETLDVRRKILNAMARRISTLANEFDLPSLLGILQCYTVHDMTPHSLEPLAIRATNHIKDFTPHECATLSHVLRKFRIMRIEICERLLDQMSSADQFNAHMAHSALVSIRSCWTQISDGGRNALNAEPTRQKLRAMGEAVGARLDEVEFPNMFMVLSALDIIVTVKIYVPKKSLQSIFERADYLIALIVDPDSDLIDPKTGKRVRQITLEEGRQLQALLLHYGPDLAPALKKRLEEAFREGLLPDESSI